MSADGNTALVGGVADNGYVGATWVYIRGSDGVWLQQGPKLVGTDAVGTSYQGVSAALSADGNTAIVGGYADSAGIGAAWVYTRSSDGVWRQQGSKLVGAGARGDADQGYSVALSADGNTAIVGGFGDSAKVGAAWVFTRSSDGVWTQQGPKLVGTGYVGSALQGRSVALSADGNIALVGGSADSRGVGATWVFTRSGDGAWAQQGSKLVGTGAVGTSHQGVSVALSADGNTAIFGGGDDNYVGAAWAYSRSNGVWTQQGPKLLGTGAVGNSAQGSSVALSADGNTAIVGAPLDSGLGGAAWIYTRSNGVWAQQGSKLVGSGAAGTAFQGLFLRALRRRQHCTGGCGL